MNKRIRVATIASLMLLLIAVGSVSAVIAGQSPENRADRMVGLAENAAETVGELIDLVTGNLTALEKIETAGLTEQFDANVSLYYDEGLVNMTNADEALDDKDYEGAIANATEALSIFREVYRSIHIILFESEVKIGPMVDVEELEEAIARSLERVGDLKALISTDAPIYQKLIEAEEALDSATGYLPDNVEDAKASLREANGLISEVIRYLKQVAQELTPSRIRDYCEQAGQYRERFREQFRGGWDEGFDVNGFLQTQGYQNEDDFMARFQEMIENAKGTEDIEDLEEIGRVIREMDQNLNEELGRHRARHGQEATGSGYGQNSGGYGGSSGSGQPGYGGGQ